jgi:hypothetical protein
VGPHAPARPVELVEPSAHARSSPRLTNTFYRNLASKCSRCAGDHHVRRLLAEQGGATQKGARDDAILLTLASRPANGHHAGARARPLVLTKVQSISGHRDPKTVQRYDHRRNVFEPLRD